MQVEQLLLKFFSQYYHKYNYVPDSEVAKIIMIEQYDNAVRSELIKPIEEIEPQQKEKLVSIAGQSRIKCKILHIINFINNEL